MDALRTVASTNCNTKEYRILIIKMAFARAEVSTPSPPLLSEIKDVKPFPLLNSRE